MIDEISGNGTLVSIVPQFAETSAGGTATGANGGMFKFNGSFVGISVTPFACAELKNE
jgi:hypothetical protein